MTPGQVAHVIAQSIESQVRQQLHEAIEGMRVAGATPEAVNAYLVRCAGAGRVLDVPAGRP